MSNGFWATVLVIVLVSLILFVNPNIMEVGVESIRSNFDLANIILGRTEGQSFSSIIADRGILNVILELFEFLAIAILVEYLQEIMLDKPSARLKNTIGKLVSIPVGFGIGIMLRFATTVILYYGKTQLGQVGKIIGIALILFVVSLIVIRCRQANSIWQVFTQTIIPLLAAWADMMGLQYAYEGLYRNSIGIDGAPFMTIGIMVMIFVRAVSIIKIWIAEK